MTTRTIVARAPTRIDLAGGTVDIWPLFLFLKNPATVNVAIDLFAEVQIQTSAPQSTQGEVHLISKDQNVEFRFPWSQWDSEVSPVPAHLPAGLQLHYQCLSFFIPQWRRSGRMRSPIDLRCMTSAQSPTGAGLGGSSALGIAMVGAFSAWMKDEAILVQKEALSLIDLIRDIETTVIQIPAGLQDYYSAVYGGLQSIHWGLGRHDRISFSAEHRLELEKHLMLFYSGQSRNSGINNWELFQKFLNKDRTVQQQFQKISFAATQLETSLQKKQWTAVGESICAEWETRRSLAAGISTPTIEQFFSDVQSENVLAGKVCGAGGGGCFFLYLNPSEEGSLYTGQSEDLRVRLEKKAQSLGITVLPFHTTSTGLEVQVF